MEEGVRSSREALRAYLPVFQMENTVLRLPAFFGATGRTLHLPDFCHGQTKKLRQGTLALMACVRLHRHGLLTDQMLPLTKQTIREKVAKGAMNRSDRTIFQEEIPRFLRDSSGQIKFFQYTIDLVGPNFEPLRTRLNPLGRKLAMLSTHCLLNVEEYRHQHCTLGALRCSLGARQVVFLSDVQLSCLSDFFATLMNGRWKRRTLDTEFISMKTEQTWQGVSACTVGCLDDVGEIDWIFMKRIVEESKRGECERKEAVQAASHAFDLSEPRLWSPLYKKMSVYLAYGPDEKNSCSILDNTNGETYAMYFKSKYGIDIGSTLYRCQLLWTLPSCYSQGGLVSENEVLAANSFDADCVLLPQCVCAENAVVANAALSLESVVLPQFLFHTERVCIARAFIDFCLERFPTLGKCLSDAELEDVVGLLSAKSTEERNTYERLEWLGDGVLKLIQTDAILKSSGLKDWVSNLHEGYLDSIRSIMCSNSTLSEICNRIGLKKFIRTKSLQRGHWTPASLELSSHSSGTITLKPVPDKVCADVMEAILGFVFLRNGYATVCQVADELEITLPHDIENVPLMGNFETITGSFADKLVSVCGRCSGYTSFKQQKLLVEAFTHATELSPETSSYQRLEWIGDAVLSVAVRQWVYEEYPSAEPGDMAGLEEPIVSNETLAYLCYRYGLHRCLRHKDQTLPGRFEQYEASVTEIGRVLWSSEDCPKPMADLIESVLGSIHCDGGFEAGQNAALRLIDPVLTHCKQVGIDKIRRHPKQEVLEFGCGLLSVAVDATDGTSYTQNLERNDTAVNVSCLGVNLCRASGRNFSSAEKRACALVQAVLNAKPDLVKRFSVARSTMLKRTKGTDPYKTV
jgi:dsRNA-specific ribonuclease